MSTAIAHFGFGAAVTALVVLYLLPPVRYERPIILLGGVWGMIPDAHWVSPVLQDELYSVHNSVVVDAFWLHRTLDVLDPGDSHLIGAIMLGSFIGVSIVADHWNYTQRDLLPDTEATSASPLRSLSLVSTLAGLCGIGLGGLFVVSTLRSGLSVRSVSYAGLGALVLLQTSLLARDFLSDSDPITSD